MTAQNPATVDGAPDTSTSGADASSPADEKAPGNTLAGEGTPGGTAAPSAPEATEGATATAPTSGDAAQPSDAQADAQPQADAPPSDAAPSDAQADAQPQADAAPGSSAEGAPKKKRRKRKRKRKSAASADPATNGAPRANSRPPGERTPFHAGEEVFGKVTAVLDAAIMVDLAGKALAIFDRSEMEEDDLIPSVGDRFVASVLRDGSRGGLVVLSRKPLREEATRPLIAAASKESQLVRGLVTGVVKGGVEVSLGGLRAFAPASGMDLRPHDANFTSLLGQSLDFKVTQCDDKARDVVVTRRPMLEAEAHERRKQALELLSEGQVMKGTVRTLVEWGAFVALGDTGGLEGLIHVSEASHDPRAKIADLFKAGGEVEVKITKIDERGKIWLSRKALLEDPWAEAKTKFARGKQLAAKVTRVEAFGVFAQLDDAVEGMIHVSDLMAAPQFGYKKIEHPKDVVSVGDELRVVVHAFDVKNHKVNLHVALPEEKQEEAPQKVARNASLQVEVVRAESAGLIVRVLGVTGRASRGFIPAGQTGTARGTDLRKKFKAGTLLSAKVIDLDPRRPEPKLSIKQLAQDEERRAHREYRKQFAKDSGFGTLGDLLAAKLK